jgi:hypothetical protein
LTAVVARWDGGIGGALFVVDASGHLQYASEYRDLRNVRPVGNGRVALEYTASVATGGYREDHMEVLCSFGTPSWASCLELPSLAEYPVSRPQSDESPRLEVRFASTFTFLTSGVRVHRRVRWRPLSATGSGSWHERDLGSVTLELP